MGLERDKNPVLKINGRRYELKEQIRTNLSMEYLNDDACRWGVWELVRECMQNIMDEAEYQADSQGEHLSQHMGIWADVKVNRQRFWRIFDKGRGCDLEDILLLGISGKRGTHYRGQKGEGQLMAFLVAARLGIGCYMTSQDWALEPVVVNGNKYKYLALNIYKAAKPHPGTRIFLGWGTGVDNYLSDAKYHFPDLKKLRQRTTYTPRTRSPKVEKTPSTRVVFDDKKNCSRLYVKGIFVKEIQALFSYNLDLPLNRDRNIVSNEDLIPAIGKAISGLKNFDRIRRIIKEVVLSDNRWLLEGQVRQLDPVNPKQWASALRKETGSRRTVLWTHDLIASEARLKGYKVVRVDNLVYKTVLDYAGIRYDSDVANAPEPYKERKTLSTKANRRKRFLAQVAEHLGWTIELKVFVPKGDFGEISNGFYDGGVCWLGYNYLEESPIVDVIRTFLHEYGHQDSAAHDCTRNFENWAFQLCAELLVGDNSKITRSFQKLMRKES